MENETTNLRSSMLESSKSDGDIGEDSEPPLDISQKLFYGCFKYHPSKYLAKYKRQPVGVTRRDFNWDLGESKAVQIKSESFPEVGPLDAFHRSNHLCEIDVF
ncbi:hypothetical protein GPJ56_004755 [Histomonas meleagridis]|uniref:uncharacterized protein n=1 Tax=Histomonas meleagridis TaxID=135588 RepID=UPI00355A849D|nr:hypothetical protein GPJ56_004755 [Histomonas meleagridis]KAH0801653.1 hypothetical protein GO595_005488 [Histomonas meleagridis]